MLFTNDHVDVCAETKEAAMSTILVTGEPRFVGSDRIIQLLAAGYRVRTTVPRRKREQGVRDTKGWQRGVRRRPFETGLSDHGPAVKVQTPFAIFNWIDSDQTTLPGSRPPRIESSKAFLSLMFSKDRITPGGQTMPSR